MLTTQQAADLLGLEASVVRRYAKLGILKGDKLSPRVWIFTPEALEEFKRRPRLRKPGGGRKRKL